MSNNIESLFKIVILCGKQGLSLRGHRDDHINWADSETEEHFNQGNFIELIRFRAEHDEIRNISQILPIMRDIHQKLYKMN